MINMIIVNTSFIATVLVMAFELMRNIHK